jgi:peptidoglycan hydrolase CwlO-like protein
MEEDIEKVKEKVSVLEKDIERLEKKIDDLSDTFERRIAEYLKNKSSDNYLKTRY